MKINILDNKRIIFIGLGLTSYETALALEEYKSFITLVEGNLLGNNYAMALIDKGYEVVSEEECLNNNRDYDLVFKSPGVPLENKVLQRYSKLKVLNDIELAYLYIQENNLKTKIVGITGTNGKTSTTLFLEKFLNNSGFVAKSAGNIGISPITVLSTNGEIDYLILEISSFQLLNVHEFKPDYSFILNITPDHLNIHHDFKSYVAAKKLIYKNQKSNDYLFVKQKVYDKFLENNDIQVQVIINNVNKSIIDDIEFFDYSGMNLNNLLSCYKFGETINIDQKYFFKTLNEFEGLEHRVEFVSSIKGINFYNDSKATNLEATRESLKHLNNIILLVGGKSKKDDVVCFDEYLKNVKKVVCYGANKDYFESSKIIARVDTLEEAVAIAKEAAQKGDSVLLSPASKSFDQYKNYKVRGLHFKRLAKEIW